MLNKNFIFQWVLLSAMGVSGILTDFLLSYRAYSLNPERFVMHEANAEIISFFHEGEVPYFFYFTLVFVIVFVFYCINIIEKRKDFVYINELNFTLFLFVCSTSTSRVFAGSTWFYDSMNLVGLTQIFSYMTLGALGCLALLSVRKEKLKWFL